MTDALAITSHERYAFVQRLLHWLIAVLVLGALAGGALLYAYGFGGLRDAFGMEITNAIYKYHKTAGLLILGLMVIRLALRVSLGAPPQHASLSAPLAALAKTTHLAFYVLLITMALLGWAATDAGDFPVQFFDMNLPGFIPKDEALSKTLYAFHGWVGLAIACLATVHIAAGLRHWLVRKDGVMARISLP